MTLVSVKFIDYLLWKYLALYHDSWTEVNESNKLLIIVIDINADYNHDKNEVL